MLLCIHIPSFLVHFWCYLALIFTGLYVCFTPDQRLFLLKNRSVGWFYWIGIGSDVFCFFSVSISPIWVICTYKYLFWYFIILHFLVISLRRPRYRFHSCIFLALRTFWFFQVFFASLLTTVRSVRFSPRLSIHRPVRVDSADSSWFSAVFFLFDCLWKYKLADFPSADLVHFCSISFSDQSLFIRLFKYSLI